MKFFVAAILLVAQTLTVSAAPVTDPAQLVKMEAAAPVNVRPDLESLLQILQTIANDIEGA
jgi:hypothetical protein